jgi:hypothetical protein
MIKGPMLTFINLQSSCVHEKRNPIGLSSSIRQDEIDPPEDNDWTRTDQNSWQRCAYGSHHD